MSYTGENAQQKASITGLRVLEYVKLCGLHELFREICNELCSRQPPDAIQFAARRFQQYALRHKLNDLLDGEELGDETTRRNTNIRDHDEVHRDAPLLVSGAEEQRRDSKAIPMTTPDVGDMIEVSNTQSNEISFSLATPTVTQKPSTNSPGGSSVVEESKIGDQVSGEGSMEGDAQGSDNSKVDNLKINTKMKEEKAKSSKQVPNGQHNETQHIEPGGDEIIEGNDTALREVGLCEGNETTTESETTNKNDPSDSSSFHGTTEDESKRNSSAIETDELQEKPKERKVSELKSCVEDENDNEPQSDSEGENESELHNSSEDANENESDSDSEGNDGNESSSDSGDDEEDESEGSSEAGGSENESESDSGNDDTDEGK